MFDRDDTIAAISTAAGLAARAIVRLSGPAAEALASRVFRPAGGNLAEVGGFRAAEGLVSLNRPPIDVPARAYVFRAPRSYTRQDVIELHVPGTAPVAEAVRSAIIDVGARPAGPGEFTARAFFSGRIDLSAAEAVADVIDAADQDQLRSAMAALGGKVHDLSSQASADVAEMLAEIEASIDLADEQIDLASPRACSRRLDRLARSLQQAADRAGQMPETAQRAHVVLVGRPNVGKSALLNALSGQDRAIVSALAGTTRDVLGASMRLPDGGSVELQDAAGLVRPDGELAISADSAARRALARADIVAFVVDVAAGGEEAELLAEVVSINRRAPLMVIGNKMDLVGEGLAAERIERPASRAGRPGVATSALAGGGIERLRGLIGELLGVSASRSGGALGLHERQKRALLAAAEAARRAAGLLGAAEELVDVAELAAVELRQMLAQLGRISGQVVTEDILGRVFRRFCVGK